MPCFTRAYCLHHHNSELSSEEKAIEVYRTVVTYLKTLWEARLQLARVAIETRSFQALAQELRGRNSKGIKGFGGSGFLAKEVLMDFMNTSVCPPIMDRNQYCPVGPGARRALNRLRGRPRDFGLTQQQPVVENMFMDEMRTLFGTLCSRMPTWCSRLHLELHGTPPTTVDSATFCSDQFVAMWTSDVQFSLCEFDKYERIRLKDRGRVTRYVPSHLRPDTAAATPSKSSLPPALDASSEPSTDFAGDSELAQCTQAQANKQ